MPPKTEKSATAAAVAKYRAERESAAAEISRVKAWVDTNFAKNAKRPTDFQIRRRYEVLEERYRTCRHVQRQLELIDQQEIGSKFWLETDEEYLAACEILEPLVPKLAEPSRPPTPQRQTAPQDAPLIRMPTIELDSFSGEDPAKWLPFWAKFKNLVHCKDLDPVYKFELLSQHLSGEAANQIAALEMTPSNYNEAIHMLLSRWHDKKLLTYAHLEKVFEFKRLQRNDPTELFALVDSVRSNIRALAHLGREVSGYDDILVFWVLSRLDRDTRERWDDFCDLDDVPPLESLLQFIEQRARTLRTSAQEEPKHSSKKPLRSGNSFSNTDSRPIIKSDRNRTCPQCNSSDHSIYACQQFKAFTIFERRGRVRALNLCFRCLGVGHYLRDCKSGSCRKCGDAHHTLLCQLEGAANHSQSDPSEQNRFPDPLTSGSTLHASGPAERCSNYNLLATAIVLVKDKDGEWVSARALLDSGSQFNFITEDLRQRLGLPKRRESVQVHTINGGYQNLYSTTIEMKSRFNDYSVKLNSLIQRRITGNVPSRILKQLLQIPANIELADPNYHQPGRVDLLLSVEVTAEIAKIGCIRLGPDKPTLQNTLLGWIISGRLNGPQSDEGTCGATTIYCQESDNDPGFDMRRFWEIECVEEQNETELTPAEKDIERHFASTLKRREDGSYEVQLPFKRTQAKLGESKTAALRRLQAIERRLKNDPVLKVAYENFMAEYKSLNHMREVPFDQLDSIQYYIPHHFVLKPDSSTTKLRVVFDASAKTTTGVSLNDNLEKGPQLQSDLFSILIRFRTHMVALCGDIEKMFRQIWVSAGDTLFQGILWDGKVYVLTTVTYGTKSAPYLAVRTLIQCARDQGSAYPIASLIALTDFFMDDLMSGANSPEEAIILRQQMSEMLGTCGMRIRKWMSNSPAVVDEIPEEDRATCTVIDEGDFVKTLGLIFFPSDDIFRVKVEVDTCRKITKRTIQSDVARVFDPLGIVQPVVVVMKMVLQELWSLHLGWDESVPQHIFTVYNRLREQLAQVSHFSVPRWIIGQENVTRLEIHAFGDASERAYGAAIYIRSIGVQGVSTRLLCSKSRVAPLKKQSLARLELLAAELVAQLVTRVRKHLSLKFDAIYCWSDNSTVLYWLQKESRLFHTFVANRVSKIQSADFIKEWRHVPTTMNPADLVSRGLSPAEFMLPETQQFWLHGPKFLESSEVEWPPRLPRGGEQALPEMRTNRSGANTGSALVATVPLPDMVERIDAKFHHSARSLCRIFGYVHRFIAICRRQTVPVISPKSDLESLRGGLILALRSVQATHFTLERKLIIAGQKNRLRGPLRFLNPYLDPLDGLLHAGGRLGKGAHPVTMKNPVIIPSYHILARALMRFYHFRNQHCGPRALLAEVRMAGFWIINGKRLAATVVRQCVICFCCRPRNVQPKMGDLPIEAITAGNRAFINVAVDFAAGLMVHQEGRGRRPTKAYAAVFVCLATKAVHLELVSKLTMEAFIAAMRRFIGRRGLCRQIFCDNATNFVGCDNEMRRLLQRLLSQEADINEELLEDRIVFRFSPSDSPHFNGLAEAAVKSMKSHLRRILGTASLTYEEMLTALVMVEAALNSRPLQPLSEDPTDCEALTPAHILIGEPIKSFLEPDDDSGADLTTRYRRLRSLFRHFWDRWQKEVLTDRQARYRWQKDAPNLKVGQLVLVTDDGTRPYKWPLARIVDIHPGPDGIVRVVSVKMKNQLLRRAANRVCPLPIQPPNSPVYPAQFPVLVDQTSSGQGGRDVE